MPVAAIKSELLNRAYTMPMRWPQDKAEQKRLGDAINRSLSASARIANCVIGAMYMADVALAKDLGPDGKLPKADYPNTYQVAKHSAAAKGVVSAVFNGVEQWARKRYTSRNSNGIPYRAAAIDGRGSVPTVIRCPWPVRARITWESKGRRPHLGRGGEPFVWLPLLTEDGSEWFELELQHRATRGHRRQYELFKRMVDGDLEAGEISLYRKPNGRVMIKMVGKLPPRSRSDRSGVLYVRTRPDAMMVASTRGRPKDWWYNRDDIRRRMLAQDIRIKRLRQDMKAETRGRRGRGPTSAMRDTTLKHNRWKKHALHECAKHLVNYADRLGVKTLVFDDSERSYFLSFPWSELTGLIEDKCKEAGIDHYKAEKYRAELKKNKLTDQMNQMNMRLSQLLGERIDDDSTDED